MTIKVATPTNCKIFFAYMMAFVSNRLVDTDDYLIEKLKLDKTTPLSENWDYLGYKSLYSIPSFGCSIFAFIIWPIAILLVALLLAKIKPTSQTHVKVRTWFKNFFMFNGPVIWLQLNYIQLAASCCLNCLYFKWNAAQATGDRLLESANSTSENSPQNDSSGNRWNCVFTVVCAIILIGFPIFVVTHYSRRHNMKREEKKEFDDKWGQLTHALKPHFKELTLKEAQEGFQFLQELVAFSESQEGQKVDKEELALRIRQMHLLLIRDQKSWVCGLHSLWYPFISQLRKLLLILTCVFLQHNPTLSIFSVNFQILLMAIFIGMGEPFV